MGSEKKHIKLLLAGKNVNANFIEPKTFSKKKFQKLPTF